jgi:thioredoxin 1
LLSTAADSIPEGTFFRDNSDDNSDVQYFDPERDRPTKFEIHFTPKSCASHFELVSVLLNDRVNCDAVMNMNANKAQIVEIGEPNFKSEVLRSKQPVLVAFLAPWSRPCQVIRSALDEVAATCAGAIRVVKVNADKYPTLSFFYEIQSIPTLLYFVDGSLLAKVVGTASKEAILSRWDTVLHGGDSRCHTPEPNKEDEPHHP